MAKGKNGFGPKVVTPKFRGAFVRFFEPETGNREDGSPYKRWGCTAIFEKGADLTALKDAAMAAAKELWGDKAAQMLKHPKFKSPFKDGGTMVNKEGTLYAGFEEGQTTVKLATEQQAPDVVNGAREAIIDASECYSGAYYRASVVPMAYEHPKGGLGISFKLQNVQKLGDGERLGGGQRAEAKDEFDAVTSAEGASAKSADDVWA
jgi:hypothetical protein